MNSPIQPANAKGDSWITGAPRSPPFASWYMSASSIGVTTYLVPPITVVTAWLLLDETPPTLAYVGGALSLVSGALAGPKPRRPAANSPGQWVGSRS